jgi:hypothetical protein
LATTSWRAQASQKSSSITRRPWARRTAASLWAGPSTIATCRPARGLSNKVAAPASASLISTALSSRVRALDHHPVDEAQGHGLAAGAAFVEGEGAIGDTDFEVGAVEQQRGHGFTPRKSNPGRRPSRDTERIGLGAGVEAQQKKRSSSSSSSRAMSCSSSKRSPRVKNTSCTDFCPPVV